MKKTILALAVTSIFSTGAIATSSTYKEYYTIEEAKNLFSDHVDKLVDQGASVNYNDKAMVIEKDDQRSTITLDGNKVKVFRNGNAQSYKFDVDSHGRISKINGRDAGRSRIIYENDVATETTERDLIIDTNINNNTNDIRNLNEEGIKLYEAGSREVAKLETSLTAVNKSIRADGEAAYNKLRSEGGREVAKLESVSNALNKKMDLMESDGTKYVQEKADAAVEKSSKSLYEAGSREVAKLETSITAVNKSIRADGEAAYNKLRSEGGREVAKLESVSNALNKKMDLMEGDGTKYVQEKADAAVEKSSKSLRDEGAKSLVRMEELGVNAVGSLQAQIDQLKAQIAENSNNNNHSPNNSVIEDDTNAAADAELAKDIGKELDKRIGEAGAAAYKEAEAYTTRTDTTLKNHEGRIGNLEQDMKNMGNKMLALEDRMDGVVASSHAITNARPVLNSAGQFGMGVGMGAAGSKQAIALGGAYQITDNWSGTMSVNYETKGKVSNDQLSAGVGAQYIF